MEKGQSKRRMLLAVLVVVSMMVVMFTGCSKEEAEGGLSVIRVAVQPYYISAQIGYIIDNGLDEANGFKLNL